MERFFIPLGTKCSTAFILRDHLKVRQFSLPFDWLDLSLVGVFNLLNTEKANIDSHIENYFNKLQGDRNPEDNTWFPHANIDKEGLPTVKAKYARRMHRLFDLFESGNELVFLSTFPEEKDACEHLFDSLKDFISNKAKGKCTFITVNLTESQSYFIGRPYEHRNIHVPLIAGWSRKEVKEDFERRVAETLLKDENIRQLFPVNSAFGELLEDDFID